MNLFSDDINMDSSDDEADLQSRTRQMILEQRECHLLSLLESQARAAKTVVHDPCPLAALTPEAKPLSSMDLRARSLDRLLDEERYLRTICSHIAEEDEATFEENDFDAPVYGTLLVEEESQPPLPPPPSPPDDINQVEFEYLVSCLRDFVVLEVEDEDAEYAEYPESEVHEDDVGTIGSPLDEMSIFESLEEEESSMSEEDEEEDTAVRNLKALLKLMKKHGGKGMRKYGENVQPLGPCLKRICDADKKGDGDEKEDTPQDDLTLEKKGRICSDGSDSLIVEDILALTKHIKQLTNLPFLTPDDWNNESERTLERFLLEDSPLLTVFFQEGKLQARLGLPEVRCDYIFCALKISQEVEIKPANLLQCVQFETIGGTVDEALVSTMNQIKSSIAYHDVDVPKHIRNEFSSSLLRDLSQITEDRFKMSGLYSIYIPYLALDKTPEVAAKHSEICDLVRELINEWYFRINSFVQDQGGSSTEKVVNLSDRLDFWKYRYNNLSFLQDQMGSPMFQHLLAILEELSSTFLPEFRCLCDRLEAAKQEALSVVSFLQCLEEPIHGLFQVTSPLDILNILPEILTNILVIQCHCGYYSKSRENLTQLYLDLNYQVIDVCMKSLHMDEIFACRTTGGVDMVHKCIETCCRYRILFDRIIDWYCLHTGNPWDLDKSAIFNNLEVFKDRCKNMIEVCESLSVFGCVIDTGSAPKVTFPFSQGEERSLDECRTQYLEALKTIDDHRQDMLEFQTADWLDHIDQFRNKVYDVERAIARVMDKVFHNVLNLDEALDTLQGFYIYYERPYVHKICSEKTNQVYQMFEEEVKAAQRIFQSSSKYKPNALAYHLGRRLMHASLQNRVQTFKEKFDARPWLLPVSIIEDAYLRYESFVSSIDEAKKRLFKDWKQNLPDVNRILKRSLLARSTNRPSFLVPNVDPHLLELLQVASYWKTEYQLPPELDPLLDKSVSLIRTHNAISLLVSQYNQMVSSLSDQERVLFRLLVKMVDMYMSSILNMEWGSEQAMPEIYKSLEHIHRTRCFIDDYKQCNVLILDVCECVARVQMIDIKPNLCLKLEELEVKLKGSREKAISTITDQYCKIFNYLLVVREGFELHLEKMATHWAHYIERIDSLFEEALRLCVLNALKTMSKLLSGNQVLTSLTSVHVQVMLGSSGLEYSPSMPELLNFHLSVLPDLVLSLKILPRLTEKYGITNRKKAKYGENILKDHECKEAQNEIEKEMIEIMNGIEQFQEKWTPFENLWSLDKDKFFQLYEAENPDPSQFEKDMRKYHITEAMLSQKMPDYNVRYLILHAAPLLQGLGDHAKLWQKRFAYVLTRLGAARVEQMYAYTYEASRALGMELASVQQLQEIDKLHTTLVAEAGEKEKEFGFIDDIMDVLDKSGVKVPEIMRERKLKLPERWRNYLNSLTFGLDKILQSKESFKVKFLNTKKELLIEVNDFNARFYKQYPTQSDIKVHVAFEILSQLRAKLADLKQRYHKLSDDLNILKVTSEDPPEFIKLDTELDAVQSVWNIAQDWSRILNLYRELQIDDINVEQIQDNIEPLYLEYGDTLQMYKDKDWGICEHTMNELQTLWNILPLISKLRTPNIRQRHWEHLKENLIKEFDETAPDFTLAKMIKLNFHKNVDLIEDISYTADKEAEVELYLGYLQEVWDNMQIQMKPTHKPNLFWTEKETKINRTLEDNLTKLGSLKSSIYATPFMSSVDHWEKILSDVMECLELFLQNQELYVLMETVVLNPGFRSERTARACDSFDRVTNVLETMTTNMNRVKNAVKIFTTSDIHDKLYTARQDLELVRRVLENFLKSKRQVFPRFYFISDELMLDIFGHSKRPDLIMSHYKQLFDGIDRIEFQTAQKQSTTMEALGIYSAQGEYVLFNRPEPAAGKRQIDDFLLGIEKAMQDSLCSHLANVQEDLKTNPHKRDSWVKKNIGMLCIVASQMQWTANCTEALQDSRKRQSRKALKSLKKKQTESLGKFSHAIKGNLSSLQRLKFEAITTFEIHARDVIEKMYRGPGPKSELSFEWLSQLRYYLSESTNKVEIKQTNTSFTYGYEYLGNSGRLVITPLTDRCFITLTTALHLHRGGRLRGPTGTGKSETVKDLGKCLAYLVVITNCSESLDYKSLGQMFSGLVQQGAWGIFDEFNRTNIEVLSVVAQQVLDVFTALSQGKAQVNLEGSPIRVRNTVGLFLCMNPPGYSGRTELPDNLKSMFRPIAMMVPDSKYIAEITLFAGGFDPDYCQMLANKVTTMFNLFEKQLSPQKYYDFGLRGIITILRHAGEKRKQYNLFREEEVLLLTVRDITYPKITTDDRVLFDGITSDIFPLVEVPPIDNKRFTDQVKSTLQGMGLDPVDYIITKVSQLYETKLCRHCVILVGGPGSAKSTTWRVLKEVQNACYSQCIEEYGSMVTEYIVNPKAVSIAELYGDYNNAREEWSDGIVGGILRKVASESDSSEKWIIFDGPVDVLWIESMNSLMDDNRLLTLINSERISLPLSASIVLEVEDLAYASPSTISRCAIVCYDVQGFGWRPFVNMWLRKCPGEMYRKTISSLINEHIARILAFRESVCEMLFPLSDLSLVSSLCRLLECFTFQEKSLSNLIVDEASYFQYLRMWFLFCMIWGICGSASQQERRTIDGFIRERDPIFPAIDTVYEYSVDKKARAFVHWRDILTNDWTYDPKVPFYKLVVPTIDTLRYEYLLSSLLQASCPVLIMGPVGTGKTSTANKVLQDLIGSDLYATFTLNMSARTSSEQVQDMILSRFKKRAKGVYIPQGNKTLITFLDDMNMPEREKYGAQPPLELIRQWMDYQFWYDRKLKIAMTLHNMVLMGAMGRGGGKRNRIPNRLSNQFTVLNMEFPDKAQIHRIFSTLLYSHVRGFDESVFSCVENATAATLDMYTTLSSKLLPTPSKTHYLFNMKDISRVFQGLLRSDPRTIKDKASFTRLWIHEVSRVISDKLVDSNDREQFLGIVNYQLAKYFDTTYQLIVPFPPLVFCDFMRPSGLYEDITDMKSLHNFIAAKLEDYNNTARVHKLDLILFQDAIEHIVRITRVISQPRGHLLIVGLGGTGRASLCRMSIYLSHIRFSNIRTGSVADFRNDLRLLYRQTGVLEQATCFLFNNTASSSEHFEIISNILSTGEISNLFKEEELTTILGEITDHLKKKKQYDRSVDVYNYFLDAVRSNLRLVISMSSVGTRFRDIIQLYPSIINCTTLDWILEVPEESLMEIAEKFLEDVNILDQKKKESKNSKEDIQLIVDDEEEEESAIDVTVVRRSMAKLFTLVHTSVISWSERMLKEMQRHNYVTLYNYILLVRGYKKMLKEKRQTLAWEANNLRSGLIKIDETQVIVEEMKVRGEENQVGFEAFAKECDLYIGVIRRNRRETDDMAKQLNTRSKRIEEEKFECQELVIEADNDLQEAMPAMNAAVEALGALNKKDLTELKSFPRPNPKLMIVLDAVMTLLGCETSFAEAKKQLGEPKFLEWLYEYDKDHIPDKLLKKITDYVRLPDFDPEEIGTVSIAAKSLAKWVIAIEKYGQLFKVIAPKRAKLDSIMASLKEKEDILQRQQREYYELQKKVQDIQDEYEERARLKEELNKQTTDLKESLERASLLLEGLVEEKFRWEESLRVMDERYKLLPGDCLLGTGFLTYLGPFMSHHREALFEIWLEALREALVIPYTPDFSPSTFLSTPSIIREWSINSLPQDNFSTENGIIITQSDKWPLVIDPQGQAFNWIKQMEAPNNVQVIDYGVDNFLKSLESAIEQGLPVILQHVTEETERLLTPLLDKAVVTIYNSPHIQLGDKTVPYNSNFRLIMLSNDVNPHYPAELFAKTVVVNFAIKEEGLEAQLLAIVVRKEKPELEINKDNLIVKTAEGRNMLKNLELELLRQLNESEGSLLKNRKLINTLQTSKKISKIVNDQLRDSLIAQNEIDLVREEYRPSAVRASILFFVLNSLSHVDPMYQYSLAAYIKLFENSVHLSKKSHELDQRIDNINDYHTYAVYRDTCQGLFARHKLLFAFLTTLKILTASDSLITTEVDFLLHGGVVMNRKEQPENPCPGWISSEAWDNLTELAKMPSFFGLLQSIETMQRDWNTWYLSTEPEGEEMVAPWNTLLDSFQTMLIIRCLRKDRMLIVITNYVRSVMGDRYVEPPFLDLKEVVTLSCNTTPLLFILSPGVDPIEALKQVARDFKMEDSFSYLSLGQGQIPSATKLIREAQSKGKWVYLGNCHLSLSWMPKLDKMIESFPDSSPHTQFRLWLSSSPHTEFPASILRNSLKLTTEPPKGIKANMKRLYHKLQPEVFYRCISQEKYKKLLYSLCYLHSILIERKKFQALGWNQPYSFNDSDFDVSEIILAMYLEEYRDPTPWHSLQYLLAEIIYGGHVTDNWDRRLLSTYTTELMSEKTISVPQYKLSSLPDYYVPDDGPLEFYRDSIEALPNVDHPAAFGHHPNADITSLIREVQEFFDSLVGLESDGMSMKDVSNEEQVIQLAVSIIGRLPEPMDYQATEKNLGRDKTPIDIVLLHEIQRYNSLLKTIRTSLEDLDKALNGRIIMYPKLEILFHCLLEGSVPRSWLFTYYQARYLGSWVNELVDRINYFNSWASTVKAPSVFWLSAFTFPISFLTAVKQITSRAEKLAIDMLEWEFTPMQEEEEVLSTPEDGVYITGLYLESAGWNRTGSCLSEPLPLQLIYKMPVIHFKPALKMPKGSKKGRNLYSCPTYCTSFRQLFILPILLKSGDSGPQHWIKRGTALLLSTAEE